MKKDYDFNKILIKSNKYTLKPILSLPLKCFTYMYIHVKKNIKFKKVRQIYPEIVL